MKTCKNFLLFFFNQLRMIYFYSVHINIDLSEFLTSHMTSAGSRDRNRKPGESSDQELIPKWASGFCIFSSRSVKSLVSSALLIANMAACKEASSMLISEANKPPIFEKTGS